MKNAVYTDVSNQNLPRQDSDVSYLNLPREDSYFIKGGKLALVKPYGQAEKIAMTASDFNPANGVKLNINKTDIPISSNLGNWTLYDGIWYYESNDKSKNNPSVAMTLVMLPFTPPPSEGGGLEGEMWTHSSGAGAAWLGATFRIELPLKEET